MAQGYGRSLYLAFHAQRVPAEGDPDSWQADAVSATPPRNGIITDGHCKRRNSLPLQASSGLFSAADIKSRATSLLPSRLRWALLGPVEPRAGRPLASGHGVAVRGVCRSCFRSPRTPMRSWKVLESMWPSKTFYIFPRLACLLSGPTWGREVLSLEAAWKLELGDKTTCTRQPRGATRVQL